MTTWNTDSKTMNIPDQADLLATLKSLEDQVATLTTERDAALQRATASDASVAELTAARDAAQTRATAAEQAAASAREEAARATQAKAAAESRLTDLNARVAAEVKRLGLARTPAGPDPLADAAPARRLTATERVLAAKGLRSLAELKAQPEAAS